MARYAKHTFRSGRYNNGIVKKRGIGMYILLSVMILALIIGVLFLFKALDNNNYNDEASFIKYAERYFNKISKNKSLGEEQIKYNYDKPLSSALSYPKVDDSLINKQIKDVVDLKSTNFYGKHEDAKKDEKLAFFMTYNIFKGSNNTYSIALLSSEKEENKKGNLVDSDGSVTTFTYSNEGNSIIYPVMAFEAGYQEKLSNFFKEYVEKEYKGVLSDDYEKYISKDNRFEKFVLDDDKAIFYFDANTITKDGKIVEIKVSNSDVKNLFRKKINERKLDPKKPMIALTFDDGPSKKVTPRILDILEKNKAVATFFELGENIEQVENSKELLKKMESLGCEIGSHSYSHPNLFTLTDEAIKEQNDKTDEAIKEKIGYVPTLYRPPYGNGNENTTKIFNKSAILWSIDTFDWKHRNKTNTLESVTKETDLDGRVVLMHSLYDSTADAIEEMIPWLQAQGYQLVTVSELLTYKFNEDPNQVKFYGYGYFKSKNIKNK